MIIDKDIFIPEKMNFIYNDEVGQYVNDLKSICIIVNKWNDKVTIKLKKNVKINDEDLLILKDFLNVCKKEQ